ncbi:MAG TPA: NfeD family protein [Solirubrobacterales bacterium]|nr:NfeD family protein [Solirubrobacterales bacterium]
MLLLIAIALLIFVVPAAVGVVLVVAAALAEIGEFLLWRRFLARYRVVTGAEGLAGERGIVGEPCDPDGTVRVRGEIWKARCSEPAERGEPVEVAGVDGLTLIVTPVRH